MKERNNPAKVSCYIAVTYVEGYSPARQRPRTMGTAVPLGQAHFWIVAPNQSPAVGGRETPIVKSGTKATSAEVIASEVRSNGG